MILPDRAYAFFSHTHKAQRENMPLLDKVHSLFTSLWTAIFDDVASSYFLSDCIDFSREDLSV